jgi:hypothetical protein
VAEAGDFPEFTAPAGQQAAVSAKQIAATIKLSELMMAAGQGEGSLLQTDIIAMNIAMTIRNHTSALNRYSLAVSNAILGSVEATVSTSATFVAALPHSFHMLRNGMLLDFYTGATPGEADKQIGSINMTTRTVTFVSGTTLNATAGDLFVQANSYGAGIFGLREICDDGTDGATTLFGITRSTSPQINATVLNASGGLQSYQEALVRQACVRAYFETGLDPTAIWCNEGIVQEHLNSLTGSRFFSVGVSEGVPSYKTGINVEKAGFVNGSRTLPFKVETDLPARELYVVHEPLFRRHVLRKTNWWGDGIGPEGSGTPYWLQSPASTGQGYASAKIAGLMCMLNLAHLQPRANVRVSEISDSLLAND